MEDNIDKNTEKENKKEDLNEKNSLEKNNLVYKSIESVEEKSITNINTHKPKTNEDKSTDVLNKNNNANDEIKIKSKKEIPIEKKPFNEFINDHLIPSLIKEFKDKGLEVNNINLENTSRPIAGDICWVIYCEVKETCNFWLSFEKEDISSLKSISLCRANQSPSVMESFLIDERKITLKLIISRILQRLNGQKLIGIN